MTPLVYCLFIFGVCTTISGFFYLLIKRRSSLLFFGLCLGLLSMAIFYHNKRGSAVSLDILEEGKKYEVVAIYEKYLIIKTATDALKFIGPLDSKTLTTGIYVKTDEARLEKIR